MADPNTTTASTDEPPGAQRARDLLPWYAMNALGEPERIWMAQWLHDHGAHPAAMAMRAEIEWLQSSSRLTAEPVPSAARMEAGLELLMQRIAKEPLVKETTLPAGKATRPSSSARSWFDGVRAWLAPRGVGFALAASALVVVQAGVIGMLIKHAPAEQEPLSGPQQPAISSDRVILIVAFRADVAEGRIRSLLREQQAQIVGGPSALGLYQVAVPKARVASFTEATDIVESAQGDR